MRVVNGEWFTDRPFRDRIQVLRPNASESISIRLKIDTPAVRGPGRIPVDSIFACDRNPFLAGHEPIADACNEYLPNCSSPKGVEDDPAAIGAAAGLERRTVYQR